MQMLDEEALHQLIYKHVHGRVARHLEDVTLADEFWLGTQDAAKAVFAHFAGEPSADPKPIEVDIGAAAAALEASPELCAMMNQMVGGPALVAAQQENEKLRAALTPFAEPHAMGDAYVKFAPHLIENARAALSHG